ncbi:MAG: hypothetical protein ACJAY8_000936, partial [Sphingobacteriales bacterium]
RRENSRIHGGIKQGLEKILMEMKKVDYGTFLDLIFNPFLDSVLCQ